MLCYATQKQQSEVFYKKKVLLKILQNSQENICARVYFLIKWCFPVNFFEIFKSTLFTEYLRTASGNINLKLN